MERENEGYLMSNKGYENLPDRQPVQEWVCKCRVVDHQDRILRLEDQKGVEQLPAVN